MPGIDKDIAQHYIPTREGHKPVKQKLQRLRLKWAQLIKEDIEKQIKAKFLEVVGYLKWFANVVPVHKKDGKVRICVDYMDLNKTCPKDDFPLPHIDVLIDNATACAMYSYIDGFLGYNQILMAIIDIAKTAFITEYGTYCYRAMTFGLKNVTY